MARLREFIDTLLARLLHLKVSVLRTGMGEEDNRFIYQKKLVDFKIKPNDKVLDIGSGGFPFPLATHIADLYPEETSHRQERLIKDQRPFYVCDIHKLPFKDKEFDFVYCSHVLEHLADPIKACQELMRVAKRGYIETPTKTSDIMLNFLKLKEHHLWHIHKLPGALIFIAYQPEERIDTGVSNFYYELHSKYQNPFQTLMRNNHQLFDNMFLWDDKFQVYVFDREGKLTVLTK